MQITGANITTTAAVVACFRRYHLLLAIILNATDCTANIITAAVIYNSRRTFE
jgi:hypothetical protein